MDAYNANPMRMKAALENFAAMSQTPKPALLGGMKSLASMERRTIVARDKAHELGIETHALWLGRNSSGDRCESIWGLR